MKNNRVCVVCGTSYAYCPNCEEFSHLEPWHTTFHDNNCHDIFRAAAAFKQNKISKEDARKKLEKCDLSNKNTFKDSIKEIIDEVFKVEYVAPVVEEIPTEEIAEAETEEVKIEEVQKPAKIRSRYRR